MRGGNVLKSSRVALEPMRFERLRDATWAAALPMAVVSLGACGASPECSCPDPSIHVRVPGDRAASVVDVVPSGAACASAKPTCIEQNAVGACTVYRVGQYAAGVCHVDIDFAMGAPRFSSDARVVAGSGCCGGFVTDPPSAAVVDVPSATDAGGAG